MPIDFDAVLYGPIHDVLGTSAVVTPLSSAGPATITVIDESATVALPGQYGVELETVQARATVRAKVLAAAGLVRADLRKAGMTMNGKSYRIDRTEPRPTANGETDGEVYLWLLED